MCDDTSFAFFDLHFSKEQCSASFHVFLSYLYVVFGEMSVHVFCPFFDWVVCFSGIELPGLLTYFEDPLLVSFLFSHSECCLFTLLIVFLVVQKLLIRSHWFIFVFISITLGGGS